jgi:cephalosporin hydroxylase
VIRARLVAGAKRLADPVAAALARIGRPITVRGADAAPRARFDSSDALVTAHFAARSDPDHINFSSLLETLRLLEERPSVILETGSSAWGTDSSRLFDDYVASFGGEFRTVDIRIRPLVHLRRNLTPNSVASCDDSVRFLRRWVRDNPGRKVDLVYLDSFDLDVNHPMQAADHGLQEFEAIRPALQAGSLLLVDDTPAELEWFSEPERDAARDFHEASGLIPGKGMLIEKHLRESPGVTKIHHRYQVLYRFE